MGGGGGREGVGGCVGLRAVLASCGVGLVAWLVCVVLGCEVGVELTMPWGWKGVCLRMVLRRREGRRKSWRGEEGERYAFIHFCTRRK